MRNLLGVSVLLLLAVPALAARTGLHYDLTVVVGEDHLEVEAQLTFSSDPRPVLELELAPTMEVVAMDAGSPEASFTHEGSKLTVDRSGCPSSSPVRLTLKGAPRNQFSKRRGGFLRTAVGPEATYIRSQYPWYPRLPNELATYRTVVKARKDWLVRTAGESEEPSEDGDLRVWTFRSERPIRAVGLVAGPYVRREAGGAGDLLLDAMVFRGHEDGADRLLKVAQEVIQHYRARFGDVDKQRFTLVEMPPAFGVQSGSGEEGYVLIGADAFGDTAWGPELVAHEIAHTWWGTEVAFRRFASESLASYATLGWIEAAAGADRARQVRRSAIERFLRVADAGKEVALADIEPWGEGMDPEIYRTHAYEKGMMILVMLEDVLGRKAFDARLRAFLASHRGGVVDWSDLCEELAKGPGRQVVEQWETPGVPTLEVTFEASKSGRGQKVKGTITQEGTPRPYQLTVPIVARSGEKTAAGEVKMTRREAKFSLVLEGAPDAVILDPDWRLLARAPRGVPVDADAILDRALKIVSSPHERDRAKNEEAIRLLRELLAAGAGGNEGLCHTGIGRCLFRLDRNDEAKQELEEALRLGGGGPFHREWIHLRLGCIADLAGERSKAEEHYRQVISAGKNDFQTQLAKRYLQSPYRGD